MRFIVFALLVGAAVTAASEDQGSKKICEPGKVFKEYCNTCRCSPDGTMASCTLMLCHGYNKDGSRNDNFDVTTDIVREKREISGDVKRKVCEPGKFYKKYCNGCICSNDGTYSACTLMQCPPGYNKDGSTNDEFDVTAEIIREKREINADGKTKVCEPGQFYKKYCNGCICSKDGTYSACTLMLCPPGYNKDGSTNDEFDVSADIIREKREINADGKTKVCEAGKSFKNYCNSCKCSDDGTSAACTYMLCPSGYNKDGSRNDHFDVTADIIREKREINADGKTKVCEAGKSFKNYCNSCKCSDDGTSAACTFMLCPPGYNEDGSRKDSRERREISDDVKTKICEPKKKFFHYCNGCICSDDGESAACTYKACPPGYNKDGSRNEDREKREISDDVKTKICEPKKKFFHYCNGCICSDDGESAACTYKECPPGYNKDGSRNGDREKREISDDVKTKICEPKKKFFHYCNGCICSDDGESAACTYKECPPGYNKDGSRNEDREKREISDDVKTKICEPKKKFFHYCNGCICSDDGESAACTYKECPPGYNKDGSRNEDREKREISDDVKTKICEPKKKFFHYCNGCICSDDGESAACTYKECPPGYNKDGSRNEDREKREIRGDVKRKVCEPGKSFKKDCNDCKCSNDGTSAACTRMACPPRMFNNDASQNSNLNSELLREKREAAPARICEPGKSFKKDCNDCKCSNDGTSAACTRMACPPRMFNNDASQNSNLNSELLREKREAAPARICEPGKSFKKDCNDCKCSNDGTSAACTRMACPPRMFNNDASQNSNLNSELLREKREAAPARICEPGKSFQKDCNDCKCSNDGTSAACTRMACPPAPARICEPGKSFKKDCNDCKCSNDGTSAACTRMACPPRMFNNDASQNSNLNSELLREKREAAPARICEPGKSFKKDCNDCKCSNDGTSAACTRMACPPRMFNNDASQNSNLNSELLREKREAAPARICEPGKSFQKDCNDCKCSNDGTSAACTRMACPPAPARICEPGKSFKKDCNDCKCSNDGTSAACTRMACLPGMFNRDGSLNTKWNSELLRNKREADATMICEPGKSFKDYCNTCSCSLDGKDAACTKMYCPPGMFNKDGSENPIGSYKLEPMAI